MGEEVTVTRLRPSKNHDRPGLSSPALLVVSSPSTNEGCAQSAEHLMGFPLHSQGRNVLWVSRVILSTDPQAWDQKAAGLCDLKEHMQGRSQHFTEHSPGHYNPTAIYLVHAHWVAITPPRDRGRESTTCLCHTPPHRTCPTKCVNQIDMGLFIGLT